MSHSIIPINPQVRESFQVELADASNDPALWPLLSGRSAELLPRFARYHTHLTQLPRRARRTLQRQWRRSLSALALLLALGQAPALAATIPVNGSTCALIDAITAANTDTAVGGCLAGSGADVLQLVPKSTHTLTTVNNTEIHWSGGKLYNGLPVIVSAITIEGHGSTIKRAAGAPDFRIFSVRDNGVLTLNETKVTGGGRAGIAVNYDGTLRLTNSTVTGSGFSGLNLNYGAQTDLINSTVSNNINGNGVSMQYSGLRLINSTVSGNLGGLTMNYSSATLTNSTVSGNRLTGLQSYSYYSTITLVNSTVTGNSTGILFHAKYGNLSLSHSLVAGNKDTDVEFSFSGHNNITSSSNLFGHDGITNAQAIVGFTPDATDIIATSDGTNPTALANILNPTLTRSGGTTLTHNLVIGSPAVDAVTTGCPPPATDQRGRRAATARGSL